MFAWILDGADTAAAHGNATLTAANADPSDPAANAAYSDPAATLRTLPPPLRLLYRAVWKPRYDKTPRW